MLNRRLFNFKQTLSDVTQSLHEKSFETRNRGNLFVSCRLCLMLLTMLDRGLFKIKQTSA